MSTPHRGLPPPAAMTLPQPGQQPPPLGQPPLSQPMGQLPAPPQQWQGAEESMRNWLHAKAEEDKGLTFNTNNIQPTGKTTD